MESKNWKLFGDWVNHMLLHDWPEDKPKCLAFLPYISTKKDDFNHRALGRAAQMPETATRQNKECLDYLQVIHAELVALGHMVLKGDDHSPPTTDGDKLAAGRKRELNNLERHEYERLKEEVIRLNEELRDTKAALKRYGKMQEYLAEFGVLPR